MITYWILILYPWLDLLRGNYYIQIMNYFSIALPENKLGRKAQIWVGLKRGPFTTKSFWKYQKFRKEVLLPSPPSVKCNTYTKNVGKQFNPISIISIAGRNTRVRDCDFTILSFSYWGETAPTDSPPIAPMETAEPRTGSKQGRPTAYSFFVSSNRTPASKAGRSPRLSQFLILVYISPSATPLPHPWELITGQCLCGT